MRTVELTAADISCDHCKRTIENGLSGSQGVSRVVVDIGARVVHIDFDERVTSEEHLAADLDDLGYPVEPA